MPNPLPSISGLTLLRGRCQQTVGRLKLNLTSASAAANDWTHKFFFWRSDFVASLTLEVAPKLIEPFYN